MNKILENRYTGWFKASIVSINPDLEELEKIKGEEIEKEPVYSFEKRGKKVQLIDFYFSNQIFTDIIFKHSIFITDEEDSFKSMAKRFINQSGDYQITNDESNLFSSFTNFQNILSWKTPDGKISEYYKSGAKPNQIDILGDKEYRICKKGEYELFHLWMMSQEKIDKNTNYLLDIDKIIEGDISQIKRIELNIPLFSCFCYVKNEEPFNQKVFPYFMPLNDYRDLCTDIPSKYSIKKFKEWKEKFEYYKEEFIYKYGRIQKITKDILPEKKQFDNETDY